MPALPGMNETLPHRVSRTRQSLISAWVTGQSSTYRLPPLPPGAPIFWLLCLCMCLSSPWVLAGPWEEPGTHRHWLVVSNASTNSRFHGSQGGGRVRALRPAGASWVLAPTLRDLIVPLVAPPRAATWEGSHFTMTPWHQNVTSNSKVQRQRARQMSPQMDRRFRGRATVTQTSIPLTLSLALSHPSSASLVVGLLRNVLKRMRWASSIA